MKHLLQTFLLRFGMWLCGSGLERSIRRKAEDPARAQMRLLQDILRTNADTTFGRRHRFTEISSVADFRNRVPVQDYETLRPYIRAQGAGRTAELTREMPVFYARTSGTTGEPRDIPVTPSQVRRYRDGQRLFSHAMYCALPKAFSGRVLALGGPPTEGMLDCGIPYGSMSGLLYGSLPRYLRSRYVLTPETLTIADHGERYFAIAREAATARDVTLLAAVNPSTLLRLDRVLNERLDDIINAVSSSHPRRGAELRRLARSRNRITFADLWPGLAAVTTWTAGNCGLYLGELKALLPRHTRIVEMGYLASEFRGGIVVDALENRQIPNLDDNFYEFVERSDRENGHGKFLLVEELEPGRQYHVFVTTPGGLYRYDINDIIEVDGWFESTPTFRFLQKGQGVTSLTGEKLSESQVVRVMGDMTSPQDRTPFFLLLASKNERCYHLYVESPELDAGELDERMGKLNLEFRAKRDSGRLPPIRVRPLMPGAGEAYRNQCIARGQRESQFKMLHLQYEEQCAFDFVPWLLETRDAAA